MLAETSWNVTLGRLPLVASFHVFWPQRLVLSSDGSRRTSELSCCFKLMSVKRWDSIPTSKISNLSPARLKYAKQSNDSARAFDPPIGAMPQVGVYRAGP